MGFIYHVLHITKEEHKKANCKFHIWFYNKDYDDPGLFCMVCSCYVQKI